jgi:hypothetical protein
MAHGERELAQVNTYQQLLTLCARLRGQGDHRTADWIVRMVQEGKVNRMKLGKRFYVSTSPQFQDKDFMKATLTEAVAHGTSLVIKGKYKELYVVKVVKVIKRAHAPVIVEDVR